VPTKTQTVGKDQYGISRSGFLSTRGDVMVAINEPPVRDPATPSRYRFFSQYADLTGDGTGSTDMAVDGSTTPVEFKVSSSSDYDIRIMKIVIYIRDGAVVHDRFGNITTLTNGLDISMREAGVSTPVIEGAKNFAQLIQQTGMESPFGDSSTSFEITNVDGTDDAILLPMTVGNLVPNGIRVARTTDDALLCVVNDDLTALSEFTIRVMGYRHYP